MKTVYYIPLLLIFCSCTSIYIPTVRNVPLFSKKGDFQGTLSAGNGYNLQVAYSPVNHVLLAGNALYANNRYNIRYDFRVHQAFDLAVGYYISRKYSFEIFSGYGKGKGYGRHMTLELVIFPSIPETAEGFYEKYFVQPTIGRSFGKFQMAITSRFTLINFNSAHFTRNNRPLTVKMNSVYFIEPCFTAKFFPLKDRLPLFAFAQGGLNLPLTRTDKVFFDYSIVHLNIGAGIRFRRK